MKKLIIFDLDGTLLNTIEDLTDSVNFALDKFSMPKRTISEVRSFVGNGIAKLIERAVPKNTNKEVENNVYKIFKEHYTNNCNNKTRPYDGILKLLENLKQNKILTGIVSNKNNEAVKKLSDIYFSGVIDETRGFVEGSKTKPNPDSVNFIINKFNIDKKDCLYVGDSDVDYYTAKNAEIDCIIVSWGFKDRDFLEKLDNVIIVDSIKELQEKIYDWFFI